MIKILLVEDDPILATGLVLSFELEGYQVIHAKNATECLSLIEEHLVDLFILDIGLPDMSGLDLAREVKRHFPQVPLIFLTAQTDEDTVVRGLEIGGNDFIKKPFSHRELLMRIKVQLRSNAWAEQQNLFEFEIYPERREIHYKNTALPLNRRQFEILSYLLRNEGRIVTRDQLMNNEDASDRTVDTHISQLRKILAKHNITHIEINSIYGSGYRLEAH
ncbi:MAG TPA: response regulator transcription factor [Bacteriovoracaceae bacterium]|nr:response regulator transcription factor [Bacteriovoracaceae bacterium]